ncbi:NlpC/P60 family protein [Bacteroidota bacterium]
MIKLSTKILIIFLAGLLISCNQSSKSSEQEMIIRTIIDETKSAYAPDGRTEIFDIEIHWSNEGKWVITGETSNREGKMKLLERLTDSNIGYQDSIQLLPDSSAVDHPIGLVHISVANLRGEPSFRAELVTQAIFGTPLRILKDKGWWMLVQTPDQYISWINQGGVTLLSEEEYREYLQKPKIIFTEISGSVFQFISGKKQIISDLVAGSVLELLGRKNGFDQVKYPDGRKGFIDTCHTELLDDWAENTNASQTSLLDEARRLMGRPYLWGGTSTKGMDCSGFTKTVYFMNGVLLPRDASQQMNTGILVDSTRNFDNLEVGDLLFFGRHATDSTEVRIVHVAMWIGNGKFIHASGDVNIRSMDPEDSLYDEYNYNRYIRSKRIINQDENAPAFLKNMGIY